MLTDYQRMEIKPQYSGVSIVVNSKWKSTMKINKCYKCGDDMRCCRNVILGYADQKEKKYIFYLECVSCKSRSLSIPSFNHNLGHSTVIHIWNKYKKWFYKSIREIDFTRRVVSCAE